ncbi:MAG TPA: NAD(P)-dependent oxidoreductase [Thermomicrobiales bacterium]|nr:NAD(P)-dependent oxidoreductase [Thermomicrobiales bacterium]
MRVLVTGAAGVIGTAVREHLGESYDLVSMTRRPAEFPSVVADISDLAAIEPAFEGIDAVVHLAATISVTSPWEDVLRDNIIGTYNIFEAAKRAGVGCVVFASSNHAVGMYEVEASPDIYALEDPRVVDHHADIRPDSYYGISKAYGEAMGRYYSENFGMRVYCLRIGTVRGDDDPRSPEIATASGWLPLTADQAYDRLRATWLSQRDCAQLIARCLDATDVPFGIYYGISNNPRQFWDISHAREEISYEPVDGVGMGHEG